MWFVKICKLTPIGVSEGNQPAVVFSLFEIFHQGPGLENGWAKFKIPRIHLKSGLPLSSSLPYSGDHTFIPSLRTVDNYLFFTKMFVAG